MWMFCVSDRVDAVPGRKETLWPNRGVLRRQTHDLLKPFSSQMLSSKCFSVDENNEWMWFWHVFISRFLNLNSPHRHFVWILLLQSIWRFTNWCVWCTTAEDAFFPHVSLFYTLIIFPQLYESVLQPLHCRKWGKHSNPSHHNLIHFRLLGVTIQHITFLYLTVAYTHKQLFLKNFILMLLQKEQGCQLSGLNWCIYSNAIKKFYLSRCYSCSCVFVFILFYFIFISYLYSWRSITG